jgi:NAD(P)-dependent dehydrogenase (short-subunit alcohol dehydrogenase family)
MKTALVTGATRGIGRAILEKFVAQDIFVIGTYNSSDQIAKELCDQYGSDKVRFIQFNQGCTKSLAALVSDLPKEINILVNNAGLGSKTVESISSDKYEQDLALMQVNALGPLWLSQEVIKLMKELSKPLKIINISSVGGGIFHFPGFRLADGMSKAAVAFMTKQLAAENTQTNIDIFAICPGATETDMFRASTLDDLSEVARESLIQSLPKHRLISPAEISDLCFFLTTSSAQIMHGAVIDSSLGLGVNPGLI